MLSLLVLISMSGYFFASLVELVEPHDACTRSLIRSFPPQPSFHFKLGILVSKTTIELLASRRSDPNPNPNPVYSLWHTEDSKRHRESHGIHSSRGARIDEQLVWI